MKGDFTRDTFDPTKHYQQVLMQQGRAQLDADWNEQTELSERRDETTAADLIGNCGAPAESAAFGVVASLADLTKVPATVANWFNGLAATERKRITDALAKGDFLLTPGRYYVDGTQCELESPVLFSEQPDRFDVEALTKGSYLLYLDVWQRHITAVEDPQIREPALGGPDTATRSKTIWQVRTLPLDTVDPDNPCASGDLDNLSDPALLTASIESEPAPDDPCIVPSSGGYRGLESQLYRVEIHKAGKGAAATWKWSRENGSVVTAIVEIKSDDKKVITVSNLGPDQPLGFAAEAWVEILDDKLELEARPGQLVQIDEVDESTRTITLKTEATYLPASDCHPKLRRWEGIAAVGTDWFPLENGVQVKFADGDYRTGHYWLIPARTATAGSPGGEIEWPLDTAKNPLALTPKGITHHFCRLGIVTVNGGTVEFTDCRCLYPALTAVPRLFYVSGDGQEVMPDLSAKNGHHKLPKPLVVGVANAQCLEQPLTVLFSVTNAVGRVVKHGASDSNQTSVPITTDADGLASCDFYLDGTLTGTDWSHANQQVIARLLDEDNNPVSLPVIFNANLSIASQVAYNPAECGGLKDQNTVQKAIARLASMPRIQMVGGDGQDTTPEAQLTKDLQVSVTSKCGPVEGARVDFTPDPGGTVTPSTATTDSDGIASCKWRPESSVGVHQLKATFVPTPGDEAIEKPDFVQFTANVRADSGSCCCVTVGSEGDFKTLKEALDTLLENRKLFDICLCLCPGDHELTKELKIQPTTDGGSKQSTRVRIAGCGRNTRLSLKAALSAHGLASFSLIDLTIVEAVGDPIIIQDCAEVTIKGCYLKQDSKTATDFLIIGLDEDTQWDDRSIATQILIENNVIKPATVNKTTATALVIADANAATAILNNIIFGQVRLYGSASGAAAQKTFDSNIASPIAAGDLLIERNATGRDAQIVGNSFQGLVVDGEIVPKAKGTTISGLFRRVSLLNNVIDATVNEWLGEHVISNGNHIIAPDNGMTVGTACGSSFICVGSSANYLPTTLKFAVPSVKDDYRESANLITLRAL